MKALRQDYQLRFVESLDKLVKRLKFLDESGSNLGLTRLCGRAAPGQRVVEAELTQQVSSEVAHRSLSARERLLLLREQYPGLENRVPHNLIASFLGITPVSFSRLRKEVSGR